MRITHLIEGTILRYDTSNIAYYVYNTVLCIYVYLCVLLYVIHAYTSAISSISHTNLYTNHYVFIHYGNYGMHCHIHFAYNSVNRSV